MAVLDIRRIIVVLGKRRWWAPDAVMLCLVSVRCSRISARMASGIKPNAPISHQRAVRKMQPSE